MTRSLIAIIIPLLFLLIGCNSTDNSPFERKQMQAKVPEQIRGKTPQKPEYVIRNGEKVAYDEWGLKEGDIIELGEGVFNLNGPYSYSTTIIGAGIDKTFVVVPGNDGWRISTEKGVVAKNLSIVEPKIRIVRAKPNKPVPRITFLNIKTYGEIRVERPDHLMQKRGSVAFFFSQLDNYVDRYNGTPANFGDDFVVAFSWLNNASHDPISDGETNLNNVYTVEGKQEAMLKKAWLNEAKFESPDSAYNIGLFNRLYSQYRSNANSSMAENDPNDTIAAAFKVASEQIGTLNTDGVERSVDIAQVENYLRQAEKFRADGNLLLASFALDNAKQANFNRAHTKIDALTQVNNKEISTSYGCYIGYRRADSNLNTSMDELQGSIVELYRKEVSQISKLISKLGSPDSSCSLEIIAQRDSYAGGDTGIKVVSKEQLWKEDPQVKAMREMYRNAANRAAEQAAQAQFTNSLDRLQSTAKQLFQNRNKIESRTDGLYLVTSNRSIKGNSAADTKGYQDQIDQANKAKSQANSINGETIKDGTKTTTEYYKTEVNYIHYRLVMKAADQEKVYDFPEEVYQKSSGPCTLESYSESNVKRSSGGWSTSCNVTGYRASTIERFKYISQYLIAPTDQFVLDTIYPRIILEVQKKRSQNDIESQLDGIILAALFNENAEPSEEYERLMQQVFGFSIPPAEFQTKILSI